MSTRRARIKAVTSLPPRRKNNDNADTIKKASLPQDEVEKAIKSPKTPRPLSKTNENKVIFSPTISNGSPRRSPQVPNNVVKKLPEKVHSPAVLSDDGKNAPGTPKTSEKVSVITITTSAKSNVFISPKSVGSPLRRPPASPRRIKENVITPKLSTPNRLNDNNQKSTGRSSDGESNEAKSSVQNTNKPAATDIKAVIPDDYNVPSVPESVTSGDDAIMDGIVPLQPVATTPKPLALLKNEIISENAEVLFDPIVPLPSPSKVRPKLRPVPRLNPLRRNSVQGSASESEDESRRALHGGGASTPAPPRQRLDSHTSISTLVSLPNREVTRVRNDSICSSVSQATAQPPVTSSPVKEKQSKSRRQDNQSRRANAMRKRRNTLKRDALTMYDLIFYNPTTNPIVPDQDEIKIKEANELAEEVRKASKESDDEDADDPPENNSAPAPQVKLGPNGEIILDEQSLVIKQSEKRKVSSRVVHEGAWTVGGSSARYRRSARTGDWSDAETVRFYRALAALGTDFMLMQRLFPDRTRRDLKLKFKKEERVNCAQVDKALRTSSKWDAMRLQDEFKEERDAAARQAKKHADELRQKRREQQQNLKLSREYRFRRSRGSKALDNSTLPEGIHTNVNETANDFITSHIENKERERKHRKAKSSNKKPPPLLHKASPLITDRFSSPKPPQFSSTGSVSQSPMPAKLTPDITTIHKLDYTKAQSSTKSSDNSTPEVPSNIEPGSLVVLTVNDPYSPSKKMLQTYMANGGGKLTPIALPSSFLNSVVGYMNKGTPKSNMSSTSSPRLTSPSSVASHDSRSCSTPSVIHMAASPTKRKRHSSYTVTQL